MKIAFLHYHLKTGGVSTVIAQQVRAVGDVCDILVLTGAPPEKSIPADIAHIPGLGYDPHPEPSLSPDAVAQRVDDAIRRRWPDGCDILHVHNPILAKNKQFLNILKRLQKIGYRLFLQIHDFAEDGRPESYFTDPYVADCHYGVINSRDYHILLKSGLKPTGLHLIPNTITALPTATPETRPGGDNIVLYPVRAIRRKNIGEAILLSTYLMDRGPLCITQPPNSPVDMASHDDWNAFVRNTRLPVVLNAGVKEDFSDLVHRSAFMLTTSITEGFGFSFLEPWTAGKLLWGRKLPAICRDFEKNDIRLDHLYEQLRVPIEWIDGHRFYQQWFAGVKRACGFYRRTMADEPIAAGFECMTQDGLVDFALLDEGFQRQIITLVRADASRKKQLAAINPFLHRIGKLKNCRQRIEHNRSTVIAAYSAERYRRTLLDTYGKILAHRVSHDIDKDRLFTEFFDLTSFSLLKWGDYAAEK